MCGGAPYIVFIVLNSAENYTPGLLRAICLVPSSCYLTVICISSRSSLLSLLPGLCVVGKFLSPPVRLAFAKLYLSFFCPFTPVSSVLLVSPLSNSAYLIIPLDSFLIHRREV